MTAAEFARRPRLEAERTRTGWSAKCPAHEDEKASLSIGEGADGRVLVHCHAGCSNEAIVAALGLELKDLFSESRTPSREIAATYDYVDENGALLFQVVRY